MRPTITVLLLSVLLLSSGCSPKTGEAVTAEKTPTAEEIRAADEASLLATSRAAGVSDADALAAKAEIDKIYDETSAKMDQAEAERLSRMKQLKDEACVADCAEE